MRKTKYIKTKEDWYPTEGKKVRVSFILLSNGAWRVCAWGGDDFGLEKDFAPEESGAAFQLYDKIKDNISQVQMRELGMYNA